MAQTNMRIDDYSYCHLLKKTQAKWNIGVACHVR